MAKPAPAVQPIELDCADDDIALQMTRWLSHLRAERRLSPKTWKPMPATSANVWSFSASIGARG